MMPVERVRAAIDFQRPDRPPILFLNRDRLRGDILLYDLSYSEDGVNEWGYRFKHFNDGTMGQPEAPVLPDLAALETWRPPRLRREERLARIPEFVEFAQGRYLLGSLGISGFTTFSFLRGFAQAVMDLLEQTPRALELLDAVFDFETRLIGLAADAGLHGIHFADDWGSQHGLFIAPELWRALFRERYRRQFQCARERGLDVWFHCCGNIRDILGDFHDIGVDVMNISQPNANDIPAIGERLRGRQCFMVPISYQTVSIAGTPGEIRDEARRLYRLLGTPQGGFIGYVEEYGCMGMTEANYQACAEAFERL